MDGWKDGYYHFIPQPNYYVFLLNYQSQTEVCTYQDYSMLASVNIRQEHHDLKLVSRLIQLFCWISWKIRSLRSMPTLLLFLYWLWFLHRKLELLFFKTPDFGLQLSNGATPLRLPCVENILGIPTNSTPRYAPSSPSSNEHYSMPLAPVLSKFTYLARLFILPLVFMAITDNMHKFSLPKIMQER